VRGESGARGWVLGSLCGVLAAAGLATIGLATIGRTADGAVNAAASSITATFMQQHAAVDAPFKKFSGTISYSAARPQDTTATLFVDVASLDLGDADASAELRKPAWFDSARYPQASFHSSAVKPGAGGHFDVTGTLTIKGRSQVITVGITLQPGAGGNAFDGSFELSRRAFGIGDPTWDSVLDDHVRVRFHLLAAGA
jgi:polyisoprenoid-binding protein YceI